ncbi:unnamed protein product [Peniophora sp. CBMAI 1063]|nr:unnamed protein product [Peniophora sp. CBMAI 1063]
MSFSDASPELEWFNVLIGLLFIAFNAALSHFLELGVGQCLITASARCIIQLTIVSHLLERAFSSHDPRTTLGIIVVLNTLAALEAVANKCKRRYDAMFVIVLASMLLSTIPMSYVGVRFAMSVDPVSKPARYIPIVGMLCGNTISKLQVSLAYVLEELSTNRARTETYLGFGASRLEACKPIAKAALRLALAPSINQMSVLGIISIPGTMTGAMLGGSSVEQAARLQMIVAFMLAASSSLATIIAVACTLMICIDDEHRIRADRIHERPTAVWRVLATTAYAPYSVVSARAHKGVSGFTSELGHVTEPQQSFRSDAAPETSRCGRRATAVLRASMRGIHFGRCYLSHAPSTLRLLSVDGKTLALKQNVTDLIRLPKSMFLIPLLLGYTSSQSKKLS